MSDERDGAGSAGDDTDTGEPTGVEDTRGQTAVVTRPQRPTGKRPRRDRLPVGRIGRVTTAV